jgi:hypothetical protein
MRGLAASNAATSRSNMHGFQTLNVRARVQAVLAYQTGLLDTHARPPSNRDVHRLAERLRDFEVHRRARKRMVCRPDPAGLDLMLMCCERRYRRTRSTSCDRAHGALTTSLPNGQLVFSSASGESSVVLGERIAVGDPGCKVVVWLTDPPTDHVHAAHRYSGPAQAHPGDAAS